MISRIFSSCLLLTAICVAANGQTSKPRPAASPVIELQLIRATPAYAELLLHKTELTSALESLLADYNEAYPKVRELRSELTLLNAEIARLMAVKPTDAGRLTLALGRMMLRKVELETELETLRAQYKDEHPDVRKLKRKIEVFESAIKEILGQ
jgi:peptidoglycan hydrolase CwlO-like protein